MRNLRQTRRLCTPSLALVALICAAGISHGERLPLRTYSSEHGLAHNIIMNIVRDSRGFLWFCSKDGLSRFDGNSFVTYDDTDGLPNDTINDLLEAADGTYWIATNGGGVVHFDPATRTRPGNQQPLFTRHQVSDLPPTNRVNVLYQDRNGRVWVGTDGGLFVLNDAEKDISFRRVELTPPQGDDLMQVWSLLEDQEGSFWIGTRFGLFRRLPDGRLVNYAVHPTSGNDHVLHFIEDSEHRLWIGHESGLIVFKPRPWQSERPKGNTSLALAPKPIVINPRSGFSAPSSTPLPDAPDQASYIIVTPDGVGKRVRRLHQSTDGIIRISVKDIGLVEFGNGNFDIYTTANGLANNVIQAIGEDPEGGIWLGFNQGAMRLTRSRFLTYSQADGVGQMIGSVTEDRFGNLLVSSSDFLISRLEGRRFITARLNLPRQVTGWRPAANVIEDHEGEWWVGSREGLYRFPRVQHIEELSTARPKAVYTKPDGLPDDDIFRMYEDSRGDIWVATAPRNREPLARWDRATGRFRRYSDVDGVPLFAGITTFCEDGSGNLWIGLWGGGLGRRWGDHFTIFTEVDGLPSGDVQSIFLDSARRLWLATAKGLCRIDDPGAERPHFFTYSSANGLAGNRVSRITEDRWGRIYVTNSRGIDQIDPEAGWVKHYTMADGITVTEFTAAFRDSSGVLWFGTYDGLFRFVPEENRVVRPPPVFIGSIQIAGVERPLFELGEPQVQPLKLDAGQNQVQIDFFSVDFGSGGALRFQHKLEGLDDDWKAPSSQQVVTYASLAPGTYRFVVRAISADGTMSESPASVAFTIPPPIWQRWWFIGLATLFVLTLIYLVDRYRVARLLEIERVRTRIATDLHDDIGSSLSQVSVLSEVVRRRLGPAATVSEPLAMMASLSRDLVDSMNDIVWAINPARDHLSDLTHRMRRFASDVFTARDLAFTFDAPDDNHDVRMSADLRREVFLIFKEAVNNTARHSACARAEVDFRVAHGRVELEVRDDGRGFDPAADGDGNGVTSMRRRAERLGGQLEIRSGDWGTSVRLEAPLRRRKKAKGKRQM